MDIKSLKLKIATYLQKVPNDFIVTDGVNTVDLLLDAINKSHQWAQLQRDFEQCKVSVDALVDLQNGVPISPLPLHGTSTNGGAVQVTVKKVLRAYIADGFGGVRPMKFVSRDWQYADAGQRWDGVPFPWAPNQRDAPSYPTFYEVYLTQMANILMLYPNAKVVVPQNPMPIFLDVIRFFPDYQNTDANTDFMLQFGDDFLMWDSCVRLNPLVKEFVPRQEGNVPTPTDNRDQAWADLIAWDANYVTTGAEEAASLD
jgi:hypothetical protein